MRRAELLSALLAGELLMPTAISIDKKTLRLGDLLHLDEPYIQVRLKTMLEAKNLELAGCYHQEPMSYPTLLAWCQKQAKVVFTLYL